MDTDPAGPVAFLFFIFYFLLFMGTYLRGRVMGPDGGFKIFSHSHDL